MSDSHAVAASDRLPWLTDDPIIKRDRRRPSILLWSLPLLALVAAASFRFGQESVPSEPGARDRPEAPVTVIPLPEPSDTGTVTPEAAPAREVAPAPVKPSVRHGRIVTRTTAEPAVRQKRAAPRAAPDTSEAAALRYWPVRAPDAAAGRMVRIGTFSTKAQAKKGWRAVTRIYPGMARIPALVVPLRSARDGRTYYRLQMGTTSQAHSEVLCQRMRIIGQSCIVVGVGGKSA